MGLYEDLLVEHDYIEVRETDVVPNNLPGVWLGDLILIKRNLSDTRKAEILFEELAHHKLTYGDILDQSQFNNRKFENYARRNAKESSIPLDGIIDAFKQGIHNMYELANFFGVTESFAQECLDHYKMKYGIDVYHNGYVIKFEPLQVFEHHSFENN
ncbi:ImmA/IrrE family metallo-endopeptidase [Staphylococcus warneri]|uniref:ImmA/IrrE family metallo-endopeptidase n=1 Tax=Staphylococcus warneri TaxID=1292 RepID=UPI000BA6EDFA|nr:ImmA/IrrE family metallo-endopeptidase [Staphylococcus warneri]MDM7465575.1 ImmA/IrrE family metallo-endopeptidase [Staphylococcus warneri]PAK73693.1 toxin [Staphylococcus pasteuri]